MNNYQKQKKKARQEAIEWQRNFYNQNWTYQDIYYYTERFERYAKQYGLIKEFRENGII